MLWANPDAAKVCKSCGTEKHLTKFGIDFSCKDGRRPTCYECNRDVGRRWLYKMEPGEFDRLFLAQSGRCAACGDLSEKQLHVDHDHETGLVRGLLCGPCNRGMGMFRDSAERLRSAATYLERTT